MATIVSALLTNVNSNRNIEKYIEYRGKQEICNCNKCCWCCYKNANLTKIPEKIIYNHIKG